MSFTEWSAVPDPDDAERDLKALLAAATKTKDSTAQSAVKLAGAKYASWKKAFLRANGDRSQADAAMGDPTTTAYNTAVNKVNDAEAAASAGPTKFSVKGNMPAQPRNMPDANAYEKAEKIFAAMRQGKNPKAAAQAAGIAEDPTIMPSRDKKSGVYHFRLSHGGTQYRLDATYEVKGETTEVKFSGVGPGH